MGDKVLNVVLRWTIACAAVFMMDWACAEPLQPGIASGEVAFFLEAETGCLSVPPVAGAPVSCVAKNLPGASGGNVLVVNGSESVGIPVTIPKAGAYRIWVRYNLNKPASAAFFVLIRDEAGEELAFHFCDWHPKLPTETPYKKTKPWSGDKTGFIWESFDTVFERPVAASLSFGRYRAGSATDAQVDCVLLTTDKGLNPEKLDVAALSALPKMTDTANLPPPPHGFVWSKGLPAHADAFSGIANRQDRFQSGLINNLSMFIDGARMVRMGFNRDHTYWDCGKYGILTMGQVESYDGSKSQQLAAAHPSPEGRFVNADGQTGKLFSLNFPPVKAASDKQLEKNVTNYLAKIDESVGSWRISVEAGGYLDYSTSAITAFREWLEAKHGTIGKLNERWGVHYANFAEIVAPARFQDGRAAWLEFREFSGHTFTAAIARQLPIIRKLDPKQRPCIGQNSGLDLFSPYFTSMRPLDFEEFIHVALAGEKYVGWDTYCADDQIACEADLMTSIGEGRKLLVEEWSNHVVDPRIAARSYWTWVSKGVAGIYAFQFQEGTLDPSYPKWALLNEDLSPKAKLAAYSDAAQEVHRLEPLLMGGLYNHAVKPVALYYSRLDLSVESPSDSLYGCAVDSPLHIYRTLRGLGYPVRWITPKQIVAGELDQVGAVVMASCNFIPQDAAAKLEGWVKAGGVVIGDNWPGAYDEYAQPQTTLMPLFGVRAKPKAKQGSKLALQQSIQGYGEVTDAAAPREKYYEKVDEVAQQPYATHPLSLKLGDFMVSGYSPEPVECVSGVVIGMTHSGRPAFVLNEYGQGKALYSSLLLGTVYESSTTRYEWDTTHSGLSYGRILDGFLRYAGVKPGSIVNGVADRVRAKLRVESPIVTPDGNVVIGLTSMNDDVAGPFELEVELPESARGSFARVFVTTQGNRQLTPVKATMQGSRLALRMTRFDTHAAIVALKDAAPMVSLELKGVTRGEAGLAIIGTNQTVEIEAVVFNPSSKELPAGVLTLSVPAGWLQSAETLPVAAIAAGGETRCVFKVRAPSLAAAKRILPIMGRYISGKVQSPPATEMVWWK